jgi:hypothetical protein
MPKWIMILVGSAAIHTNIAPPRDIGAPGPHGKKKVVKSFSFV